MVATSAPFGLKALRHVSGAARATRGTIASGASAIYQNQPVKYAADGSITAAAVSDAFLGAFEGCEYTSGTKRFISNYWPGGTVSSDAICYFYGDPDIVYAIQAVGAVAQSSIGEVGDFNSITAGNAVTGISGAMLAATTNSGNAQLQVIGLFPIEGNAWGDTYTVVEVMIGKHQLNGNRAAGF